MSYQSFLASKERRALPTGFEPANMRPELFDFQRAIVRWAVRRGRAAIFADCGLGKTLMQLEWSHQVASRTGRPVLILTPLAVAAQTVREAGRFGYDAEICRDGVHRGNPIVVTNYEKLDRFKPEEFSGVVLDESSILKATDGRTRSALISAFDGTAFKLACTATPAPNDYMELGNHAEFLGIMTQAEMLAMFFVHDGGSVQKWRLKGHGFDAFWEWVCSWAVMIRKPSDIGFEDAGFVLPELRMHEIVVESGSPSDGMLFAMEAETLQERIAARRATVNERVAEVARIVATKPGEPWLIWCNLNSESGGAASSIPGAVEIRGSDSVEDKESRMLGFSDGDIRVLVTKPSIAGFGMNWQHCGNVVFLGLSDSWEQYYQAIRRCLRFGRTEPVDVFIVTAETEGAVVANIKRKESDAAAMADGMVRNMAYITSAEISAAERDQSAYVEGCKNGPGWELHLGDCVEVVSRMESDSVDFSVFSPPFASLYTYTDSDRDMGNCSGSDEFFEHFRFLIAELHRVIKPGRLVSFHCMNLPTSKVRDGVIGIRDFRGELIREFESSGFVFHSEVCIWKDPVTAMQRTKALGLLWKQIKKDSCMSRQGIPDYLVTMRKPGDNPEPVSHSADEFPVAEWQKLASPVWMDINPSDTLQYRAARDSEDERHICPLQLEVIRRALRLWSNAGDLVLSPFAGIGSEGFESIRMGRRFVGVELKESYWRQARKNLAAAVEDFGSGMLFDVSELESLDPNKAQPSREAS